MPFQPAPDIAKVVMTFSQGGQVAQNIYHVHTSNTWTEETLQDLAQLFYNWWDDHIQPICSTAVSLESIVVRDLSEEFGTEVTDTGSYPLPGLLDSPVLPFNSTPVISWRTGLAGRSTRGRTYHVGLSEAQASGGLLETAAQTALLAAYDALRTDIIADSEPWTLRVLSRVQGGTTLPEAIGYEILSTIVDEALDSQRRRLPGRGV